MPDLQLALYLDDNCSEFAPGETVAGRAELNALGNLELRDSADLYLFWRTEGRGDEDHAVVGHLRLAEDGAQLSPGSKQQAFEFKLPALPCTYTGVALKIKWVLGIYARAKGGDKVEVEIPLTVKSPTTAAT